MGLTARRARSAARVVLYGLLIWVPLPLGSNRPFAWAVNGLAAAIMLAFVVRGEMGTRKSVALDRRGEVFLGLGFLILLVWMLIQASPFTPAFLHNEIWLRPAVAQTGAAAAISISPSATLIAIPQLCFLVAVAFAAARVGADQGRTTTLLTVVFAASVLNAAYGLLELARGHQFLSVVPDAYEGYLTGTFVNRNTAATFFALGIGTGLSLLVTRAEARGTHHSSRMVLLLAELSGKGGLYLLGLLTLVSALICTGSRAGFAAAALGIAAVIVVALRRRGVGWGRQALAVLLLCILCVVPLWYSVGERIDRLGGEDLTLRLGLYRGTWKALLTAPFTGLGAGTFPRYFPLYRGDDLPVDLAWTHAHNSYLESAASLGIPAMLLLLFLQIYVFALVCRRVGDNKRAYPAGVAAVVAGVIVGFHSLFDFSLQIAGVGVVFAALLGCAFGEATSAAASGPLVRVARTAQWSREALP